MSKDTELKFIGHPIFKQVINLNDAIGLTSLVKKRLPTITIKHIRKKWLITMLLGILSQCDSMTLPRDGLRVMGSKCNQCGLDKAPTQSMACDGCAIAKASSLKMFTLTW